MFLQPIEEDCELASVSPVEGEVIVWPGSKNDPDFSLKEHKLQNAQKHALHSKYHFSKCSKVWLH